LKKIIGFSRIGIINVAKAQMLEVYFTTTYHIVMAMPKVVAINAFF
jgi:hypothetical protein